MKYSQSKCACAWRSPLPLEWAKVKCKYVKQKLIHHFVIISEIFANQIKCQKFYLANEGPCERAEKHDLQDSTGNVPFYIGSFFSEFEPPGKMLYEKGNTHIHTLTHTCHIQRDIVVPTTGKCANQICLKQIEFKFILKVSLNTHQMARDLALIASPNCIILVKVWLQSVA